VDILPKFGLSRYSKQSGPLIKYILSRYPILFWQNGEPISPYSDEYLNQASDTTKEVYCVRLPEQSAIYGYVRARLFKEGKVVEEGEVYFVFRINNFDDYIYCMPTIYGGAWS
jgi:hypothetical protein